MNISITFLSVRKDPRKESWKAARRAALRCRSSEGRRRSPQGRSSPGAHAILAAWQPSLRYMPTPTTKAQKALEPWRGWRGHRAFCKTAAGAARFRRAARAMSISCPNTGAPRDTSYKSAKNICVMIIIMIIITIMFSDRRFSTIWDQIS